MNEWMNEWVNRDQFFFFLFPLFFFFLFCYEFLLLCIWKIEHYNFDKSPDFLKNPTKSRLAVGFFEIETETSWPSTSSESLRPTAKTVATQLTREIPVKSRSERILSTSCLNVCMCTCVCLLASCSERVLRSRQTNIIIYMAKKKNKRCIKHVVNLRRK